MKVLPNFSFSRNVKRMSHTVRVETESPLRRAVKLVERVSRTRDHTTYHRIIISKMSAPIQR